MNTTVLPASEALVPAATQRGEQFAREVVRLRGLVRWSGVTPIMAAKDLQALWRQQQGLTTGDNGVADGQMLRAVRLALGRSTP
jgi:hypothetical protein